MVALLYKDECQPSAVSRRQASTPLCNNNTINSHWALSVSTLVAIFCVLLLFAEAPTQSHAGVCNNVQNNDGCNKNNVYSCVAANSPDCAEQQQCGIDYKRNFRTGSMLRIYLGAFGNSLSSCPSGQTAANDLGIVTEAIYMFTGETTCFRTDQVSISGSSVTMGGTSYTNFTVFGDTNWQCANEKVFFKCNSNQMTISVGTQGYYYSGGWQGKSKTNNLCYSISTSWPPIRRGTQLIEDMYVEAQVTRTRGLSFCQGWGGTLMRATIPSVDSIIGQVGINDFHVGYDSGVWLYDGATYSSSTDPPRTSSNTAYLTLQGSTRSIVKLQSANNRMNIVCTRTMSNVLLTVPSRCYVGLVCRVTATSTLSVQNYHTVSDSDSKVRYVDSSTTVFEFGLSSTSALYQRTFTSAGSSYAPTATLQGQGFIPTVAFSLTAYALEMVTFPVGLILYQGKSNTFTIAKTVFGTVDTIALNSAASSIAGSCTTTGFGTGTSATMICTPTNTAGSTVSVSLDVSSQCDCGYVCSCYESPAVQSGISIIAPVSVIASATSLLLLPSQQITVTITLPAIPTATTIVGVAAVCGLTFNATSFTWVAGDTATSQTFTITAPSTITSVVSCTLVFSVSNQAPQFNAPASLPLVIGPAVVASYTALQSSMTQGSSYTFQIALTRVYSGRNILVTPVCPAATFSPTFLSFTPTTLTQSISITGNDTSCGMLLNFTDVGASDAVVPASRALTFTNMKTILVSMPTLLYVGQTTDNTIAISSTFTGSEFVNILLQWNGTAGAASFSQASTFQLSATTPSINISVLAAGAVATSGYVKVIVSTTYTTTFDTSIAPLPLEVRLPLVVSTSPTTLPVNMSTDSFYAITLAVDIGRLPTSTSSSVTVTLSFPATNFNVTPSQLVWYGSDPSYGIKSFNIVALLPHTGAAFTYTVTTSSPEFKIGTFALGSIKVYTRFTIAPSMSSITVYGSPQSISIPIVLSGAPSVGSLVLQTTYVGTEVTSPNTLTFNSTSLGGTWPLTTIRTISTGAIFDAVVSISSSSSAGVASLYDTRISATKINILPYRSITVVCNSSILFYGPNNAITCTFTIAAAPATGVTLQLGMRSDTSVTASPSAAPFTGTTLTFIFTPTLTHSFIDGASQTISMAVGDTSGQYEPADILITFSKRVLRQISIALLSPSTPIYRSATAATQNPFTLCATSSQLPDANVTVNVTVAGIVTSAPTIVFTPTSALVLCVEWRVPTSMALTVQFPVAASPKFTTSTNVLTLSVRELATVTIATNATLLFRGQGLQFTVTATTSQASAGSILATLSILCSGAASYPVAWTTGVTVDLAATTSGTISGATNASCSSGEAKLTFSGTSTIFDLTATPVTTFTIKPLKILTAAMSKVAIYGGGQDSISLSVLVSDLPETGPLTVFIEDVSVPARVQFTVTSLVFSSGVTNRSTTVTAILVPAIVSTTLRLTFSGASMSEFTLPTSITYALTINPVVNVTFGVNFSPAVVYTSPTLTESMTVTLPVVPSKGSVVVTPVFVGGSPTAVKFTPTTLTLNSTITSGVFTIEALSSTSSGESLSVVYSGDAIGYFPQPTATTVPVKFQSLGVVRFLNTVPKSIFASQQFALDMEISYAPPSSYGAVTVAIATNSTSLVSSKSTIQWTSTSTLLQTTFTVQAVAQEKYVRIGFTLSAPAIYLPTLNIPSAVLNIASIRDILVSAPSFAYVGQTVSGSLEIGIQPPTGTRLAVVITPSNAQAATVSSLFDFTTSTAKIQGFTVQALQPAGFITLTLSVVDGSQNYDAPASLPIEIRALDTVTATGINAGMYVGTSAVVTFQITRDPQCDSGSISVIPTFGSGDASFAPAAGVTFAVGGGILSKSVVLTATQTSVGSVSVSLPITGTCRTIYASVITPSSTVRIYPKEKVTLSSLSNMTDPLDGAYFTYVGSSVLITIDVGTPAIRHTGLTFKLAFAGAAGSIVFSSDTVVLAAGVNKTTVNVTGMLDTTAADMTVVVLSGGDVFIPVGPIRFKVLLTIPLTLAFAPSTQLVVVSTKLVLDVTIGSSALVGSVFVQVSFAIDGCLNSTVVEFKAGGTEYTKSLTVQGINPSIVSATLTVVLTGPASLFYVPTTKTFSTIVRPQRYVTMSSPPTEMFITSANKITLEIKMQSLPTLSNDVITVSHISSTSVVATPSTITLTTTSPSAWVTLEGTAVGSFMLSQIFGVRSSSNEYSSTLNNTLVSIPVKGLVTVSLVGYLTSMYVSDVQNVTVVLSRAPMNPLVVRVVLPSSSYPLVSSPLFLTFDSTSELRQQITLIATSDVMPASTLRFTTSGSTEFNPIGFETTLEVKPDNEIAISGWRSEVYIGSTNAITFSIAVARRPSGENNMTISLPTSSMYDISLTTFQFGPDTPLVISATLRGITPSSTTTGELSLPFTMVDPTGFYVQPIPLKVTILALELYSGVCTGDLVYEQESISVTLTLPKFPSGPMAVSLTVQKNRTSNSLMDVDPALYSVSPGRDQSIPTTSKSVTFTIKPLTSPLTVQLSFTTSGTATSEYFILTIPAFVVRFASLYPITFGGPLYLYRGLETTFSVTVAIAPPTGAIAIGVDATAAGIALSTSSVQFDATTSTTLNFTAVANTLGSFTIPISTAVMGVIGFEKATRPAAWSVSVQEPYPLDLYNPPTFVYAFEANTIQLSVDFGTLGVGETITVTLTSNASDYLEVFPASLEVSTSTPIFQIYALEPVWANFNLTFTSSARRVVLSSRLISSGLVVYFRPLKKVTMVAPTIQTTTIGIDVSVSITVSEKPSPGSTLLAELQYGGSPSNIVLPPPTQWDSSATVLTRLLTFSGRSPTNLQVITVRLYNDPQYEIPSFSFNFMFEALLQMTVDMPLIVFLNQSSAFTLTLPSTVSLSTTIAVSPLNVLSFTPSSTLNMVLQNSATATMMPSQEREVTVSFALSADDAARVAVPASRKVKVASLNQVIVNAPSADIVVYIKSTIYVRTTVQLAIAPTSGSVVTVTPQLICPSGNIVTFTPSSVVFNGSVSPMVLTKTVDIRGVIASPACSLLYAVSGSGYTSSPQSFTVETRDLHKIQLINAPTRVFLGTANRVILNVSLDSTVRMPLTDSISITFASSSPCLTISPSALFWAAGNQEDLSKIAYVTATCIGTGLKITTSATANSIFTNLLPTTITLSALALQTVTVTESTTGSTDYFMFVGGAALDMDVVIPEALADDESLTVTASYSGIQGSINIAPAVWTPSPLKPLTKKLLIQAVSVSPQARVKFTVTGPPRFNQEATGDGQLEVFGPKLVYATAPSELVVGQQVLVKVTIEDLPYPGETILVKPVWEGANTSLSWTPSSIQWVSTTIGREQYFQFTALQQSGNFNLKLVVSGSYRYVTSAYSGELSIVVPQVVTTSQLPMELTKDVRYSISINIGKLPSTANTDIYIQLVPQLNDLGLECIQLDSTQVKFSSTNPLAPVEQQIGVSVIRACPQRVMTFTVLGAVEQYSRIVAPRYFTTYSSEPFGIEWPVAMYAGSEPQIAVITLRDIIYDQEQYTNITITCNGSATFTQSLHWGYGSKSEVVVEVSNNVSEIVSFSFNITSNFLTSVVIPVHTTSFLPLIRIQQVTAVPAEIYKGDANKLKVFFNVSSLPVQLGNTPGASFELVPETMAPEISIQPTRLMWSADSSVLQFIYIVGLASTTGSVQIVFRVQGEGAALVGQLPTSISVAISPLLLIDYSVAPKELYVTSINSQVVNVTIPDNSSVTLVLSVGGETSAFTVSPSTLTFAANGARTKYVTITGIYATSRASYMIYTIASAASRIALRTMDASESMSVLALKTITQSPDSLSYSLVVGETVSVIVSPSVPNIRCTTTTTSFAAVYLNNNEILVTALQPGTTIITCTNPDTTFESLVPFTVTATSKKTISYPTFVSTYVVISGEVEAQQKFGVTLSSLPSKGMLVVEPVFDAAVLKFPLVQLQFGQYTAKTQYFFIKGLVLTNSTNITLRFSGSVSEYNLDTLPTSKCEVVNNLNVSYSLLGFLTNSAGVNYGYIAQANAVRVQFQITRQTLFSSIVVVPSNSDVKYCLSVSPCVPITLGNPLLIGTQLKVSAYVYSTSVMSNVTIGFTLTGGVDFRSPSTITIPNINFQALEKIAIDTSSTKPSLYIGGQNAQSIWVSIPAAPLAGQSVELIVTSSAGIVVSSPLLTFAASSLGEMLNPMRQELIITGITKGDNQSVSLQWRDRTAVTSATNYEDAIASNVNYYGVKALIVYGVAVSSVALPTGYRTTPYTIYLGEVNALIVSISLPTMPVLSSTVVTVSVSVSNPDIFQSSASSAQFTLVAGTTSTKSIKIYAKSVYNLATAINNSVTFQISGPPEYQQDIVYGFSVLAQPLLEMQTSLTATTVAVGTENAVKFDIWPPVPVTLTLGSIVTCGEVSFSASEALSWDDTMTKKSVSVVGTLPTTATSSCYIRTPVVSGAWSTKFVSPPLNMQMWTKARPSVSSNVAASTEGTTVRDSGMTFTISISGGWLLNQTTTSFNDWVNAGHLSIQSTRGSNVESKSVMAGLESQLSGQSVVPLITMSITTTSTLKIAIGPSSSFYASARETITIVLSRSAISTGVSLEPNVDSIKFEIYGKKESLIDSNVLGSGAASAAIAGGALSMGAATAAGKLQAIMNAFLCPNPDWQDNQNSMDWNEAPIPLSFGSNSDLGTYAAVAFSNSIVIFGCFCLHMFVARMVYYLRRNGGYSDKSFTGALAIVRFPSLLLFPMLFFYQSVVSASIKVVLYSPIVAFRAIGGITFVIVGFGVPGITYAVVGPGARAVEFISREELLKERTKQRRHAKLAAESLATMNRDEPSSSPVTPLTPGDPLKNDTADSDDGSDTEGDSSKKGVDDDDGPKQSVIVRGFQFLFQYEGEWSHPDKNWVVKYGMFFDEFRGGYRWFILVDMMLTFALGVVDGFEPRTTTECYGRLAASVFLFLIQFLSVVYCRPYINRFLNGFFIFAYFLQFLAMLLVAVALFNNTPDYDGVKIAVNLLIFFSALLMLKAILDLLRVANDHFGIEAVFGDSDGVGAVHVRVRTEKELVATREEVYQSLIQADEARRRVLFGDERESVASPLSRPLLMFPESRTPSSDQLDSLYNSKQTRKYSQGRRTDAASPLRENSAEVETESEFELIPNMNESVSETEMEDVLLAEEYAEYVEIGLQEEKEKRRKQREFNRRPSL